MVLIGDMLRRDAKLYGRKVAIIEGPQRFTYSEINSRANRLAHGLTRLGLKKNEKVAFMGNNCHEFVEYYFALAKCGLVSVPVNARFSSDEAAYIVNHSESAVLICTEDMEMTVSKMRKNTPGLRSVVSTGKNSRAFLSYESILNGGSDEEPVQELTPDDIALIMYTSGATGVPKGVITTHRNIMSNTNTMCLELRIVPEDITLLAMPLFHNGGLWPTMSQVYRGGTTVLMPHFDVEGMLKKIDKEKVTFLDDVKVKGKVQSIKIYSI